MVEVDPTIGLRFAELAEEIKTVLGVPMDVVSSRAIKPRYWNVIQKDLIDVP
jgi:predicted nucleotidyltransferase